MPAKLQYPMNHPDAKTPPTHLLPRRTSIPVETLIQSMKPEKPLVIENATGAIRLELGAPINRAVRLEAQRGRATPQQ